MARELGVVAALGSDRQGKLALWQVIARVLDQGSRLSAVRLAGGHAVGAALGMVGFDEDDLYANLDWLADNQADIESRLFARESRPRRLTSFSTTSPAHTSKASTTPSPRSATTGTASRASGRS